MHGAPGADEPSNLLVPPPIVVQDRRRVDRRQMARRHRGPGPGEGRGPGERRAGDRRESPAGHLRNALMMLDDLTRLAEANDKAHAALAGAARRMWLALAEFEREGQQDEAIRWTGRPATG
jgi:hypothetical protein